MVIGFHCLCVYLGGSLITPGREQPMWTNVKFIHLQHGVLFNPFMPRGMGR